jgi:hypothetical protein
MFGYPFDFLARRLSPDCTNVTSPVVNDIRRYSGYVTELPSILEPANNGD